jgi:3-phosphoglycerate kinase
MTTATVKKASVRQLTDAQLRGARALVRVDFNVPLDDRGHVMDDTRMRATVPTIGISGNCCRRKSCSVTRSTFPR